MSHESRIGAVIVAAGSSKRFGGTTLKQLELLNGEPIYLHSLKTALGSSEIDQVVLVVPVSHAAAFANVEQHSGLTGRLNVVMGGELRRDSVYLGLLKLRDLGMDHAIVHDAARPYVTTEIIETAIEAMIEKGAVIVAIPVVDTIKSVRDGVVDSTIPRENLWRAQTPQGANLDMLLDAYRSAIESDFHATDEASVLERAGVAVHVVMGSASNVKITYPEDLQES
jgi:2-C-methyl-D-erythritol 4-phosphate cytidylyltransferase